jgi:hypothetical protein
MENFTDRLAVRKGAPQKCYMGRFNLKKLKAVEDKEQYEVNISNTQAISRRLPTAAARVQTRVWSCGIL